MSCPEETGFLQFSSCSEMKDLILGLPVFGSLFVPPIPRFLKDLIMSKCEISPLAFFYGCTNMIIFLLSESR